MDTFIREMSTKKKKKEKWSPKLNKSEILVIFIIERSSFTVEVYDVNVCKLLTLSSRIQVS